MGKVIRIFFCYHFTAPIILLQVTTSYFCHYACEPKGVGRGGINYETHGSSGYLSKTLESGAHSWRHSSFSIKPKIEHSSPRLPLPTRDLSFSSANDWLLPLFINFCNNWAGTLQRSIFPCFSGHLLMSSPLWAVVGSEDAERKTIPDWSSFFFPSGFQWK